MDAPSRKQYSVDPADAALGSMGSMFTVRQSPADGHPTGASSSSCSHHPAHVSSGGSSSTGLHHQTSSPIRNGAYPEGNTSGNVSSSIQQCVLCAGAGLESELIPKLPRKLVR